MGYLSGAVFSVELLNQWSSVNRSILRCSILRNANFQDLEGLAPMRFFDEFIVSFFSKFFVELRAKVDLLKSGAAHFLKDGLVGFVYDLYIHIPGSS